MHAGQTEQDVRPLDPHKDTPDVQCLLLHLCRLLRAVHVAEAERPAGEVQQRRGQLRLRLHLEHPRDGLAGAKRGAAAEQFRNPALAAGAAADGDGGRLARAQRQPVRGDGEDAGGLRGGLAAPGLVCSNGRRRAGFASAATCGHLPHRKASMWHIGAHPCFQTPPCLTCCLAAAALPALLLHGRAAPGQLHGPPAHVADCQLPAEGRARQLRPKVQQRALQLRAHDAAADACKWSAWQLQGSDAFAH